MNDTGYSGRPPRSERRPPLVVEPPVIATELALPRPRCQQRLARGQRQYARRARGRDGDTEMRPPASGSFATSK